MNRLTMRNANFSGSIGATVSGTAARALAAAVRYLLPLTLSIALAGIAFAGPKLAPDLKGNSGDMMDVIVQFKNPPTKQQLKQLGAYGRMKKVFDGINAAHLTLPLSVIEAIENDPSITYISPNRPTAGSLDVVDPTVNATFAWQYGFDGTGVGVAIIDSGVSLKRDLLNRDNLSSRVVYSESFVAGEDPSDLYGHGTHVAGIVGGSGADSSGSTFTRTFRGVAPNANIINLKVLDLNGMGNDSDVISAIQRAIQLKNTYNIRIMNLSLGRPVYESYKLDPLCQAVEQAWKAGIVVVLAAGNYGRDDNRRTKGYGTIASPGNDPYVITVGATTTNGTVSRLDDKVATFSSKGPTLVDHIVKPDLVAPGNNVVSLLSSPTCTLVTKYPRTQVNTATYETLGTYGTTMGSYFRLSGTSMATPVVSGAAALLLQKQPTLTPDQIKARLMKTATKVMPLYSSGTDLISKATYNLQSDIFTVGSGYLDIAAALANNDLVALPALSPTAVYDASTKMVGVLRDLSVVWGDSVIWGDSVVWGNAVFNGTVLGTSVCWGSSVVWGDTTLAGFSVVWGDTVLGTAAPLEASSADNGDADPTVDSVTGQ